MTDGGSPITNYTIYRSTVPGEEVLLTTVGDVRVYFNADLVNGRAYYYQVSAVNASGEGPRSAEVSAIPAPTAFPWPMFRQNARHTGLSPYDTSRNAGQELWNFTVDLFPGSPAIGTDGTIYTGCSDGRLCAINPNGTLRWRFDSGGVAPSIGLDGAVYVMSANLYAINPDGTFRWSRSAGNSAPTIGPDGTLYMASGFELQAINPDGTSRWTFSPGGLGGWMVGPPAIGSDGTIYVGSEEFYRYLYAVNPDGTLRWKFDTWPSKPSAAPAVGSDGTIYLMLGTHTPGLWAISSDGTMRWKFPFWATSRSSPAVGADGVIYVVANSGLNAINPDGTLRWEFPLSANTGSSPAVGADGGIYVGTDDLSYGTNDGLYAINPNGTVRWIFQTGGLAVSSPSIGADGTVYVHYWDQLYAVGGTRLPPTPPRDLAATPGDSHVVLTWNPSASDGGSPITNYTIYRSTVPGEEVFLMTVGDIHGYTDMGLENGQRYYYQVSALNRVGEGPRSAEVSTIPVSFPGSPRDLQTVPGGIRVYLAWQIPLSDGGSPIVGYRIYRGTSPGTESFLTDVLNVLTYADADVVRDVTYYYRVNGVNAVGEGPDSNDASATPRSLAIAASGSPASGVAPLFVSFASSVVGGLGPYAYAWTFGDGSISSLIDPTHEYANPGSYVATLMVTDAEGTVQSAGVSVVVIAPLAVQTSAEPASGTVPLTVFFQANPSGGSPPYAYLWNFDDGNTSTLEDPSHTYTVAGRYTVMLTMTDEEGWTVTSTVRISVLGPALVAAAIPSWLAYTLGAAVAIATAGIVLWRQRKIRRDRPPSG